jgi:hypothetical protein
MGAFFLLALAASPAWAQHTSADASEGFSSLAKSPIRGGPYLSTIQDRFGDPILVIDYPWTMHQRVSIEVATLPGDPAEWSEVRPLYYFDRLFNGERKVAIYKCLESSAEVPTRATVEQDGAEYNYIGQRNSLGKPSVLVACRTPVAEIKSVVDRAVFPLLDPWAVDRRLLQLDLPPKSFATKGKIRVWFLRGDTVLWSEDVAWPGFAAQQDP